MALLSARRSAYVSQDDMELAAGKLKILSELDEDREFAIAYFAASVMCRCISDGEVINSADDLITIWKQACFGELYGNK